MKFTIAKFVDADDRRPIPIKRLPQPPMIKTPLEAALLVFFLALCMLGIWKAMEIINAMAAS